MKNFAWLTLIVSTLFVQAAQASYFVIPVTSASLDPHKRTHIVIAGRGNDLGTALQVAATVKVKKVAEMYPEDQILFVCTRELEEKDNVRFLKHLGFDFITYEDRLLTAAQLMDQLAPYKQIAAIHIFSHSGISPGIFLDLDPAKDAASNDVKWGYNDPAAKQLVGHFMDDAIVTLNGCNAGHVQAPYLSNLWKVPVAGALTSSHFEALFQDASYYWDDEDTRQLRSETSLGSMLTQISCASGACYRMRPDNWDYTGVYGHYYLGLPFYKFFCTGISQEKCLAGMARSILTVVSTEALPPHPTLDQYSHVVQEWLCPTNKYGSETQSRCMADLKKLDPTSTDRNYSPFGGHSAQCSFLGCYRNAECMHPEVKVCALSPQTDLGHATTFIDEYRDYLKGYSMVFEPASTGPGPLPSTSPSAAPSARPSTIPSPRPSPSAKPSTGPSAK